MLNERERRILARMEHELVSSDPEFVRLFAPTRGPRITGPALLLCVGLLVMVAGSASVSVGIALLGMAVCAVALVAAYHHRPVGFRPT